MSEFALVLHAFAALDHALVPRGLQPSELFEVGGERVQRALDAGADIGPHHLQQSVACLAHTDEQCALVVPVQVSPKTGR